MERVIGLGGPFIKANDPKTLAAWYETHLGIVFNGTTYTSWELNSRDGRERKGSNVLSFFKTGSDYFAPSEKEVMINFIVNDVSSLLEVLRSEAVTVVGDVVTYEGFGKFGWIMDPEGNKIELWEPPAEK